MLDWIDLPFADAVQIAKLVFTVLVFSAAAVFAIVATLVVADLVWYPIRLAGAMLRKYWREQGEL